MIYIRILFQHITVETSALAMTLEDVDKIFSTTIDKVICQMLKLDMDWVEKKQWLSGDKLLSRFHLISIESICFKYCS